jgi:mono/diheme cytochrome c family protein
LIVFALLSSFYFPRRNPNFPGNRLGLFILVASLLFLGTMAGVIFFAKEEEEAHGAEATETHGTETGEAPSTTTETAPSTSEGDAAAGEAVFASAGCGGCHTLEAAGSSGSVGPNLDDAKPDQALVVERVTNGMGAMPSFKGQLDEKQIQDVAAYVVASTQG